MDLDAKVVPLHSRAAGLSRAHARLKAARGAVSPTTAELPVPVRVVIDQEALTPLSGGVPACNEEGNGSHNPRLPILFWYQDTPVGPELYIVFYTLPCSWGRCSFCTLPSESSAAPVSDEQIWLQALYVCDSFSTHQKAAVKRVFLSNNGSVLDPRSFPRHVLLRICEQLHRECPSLEMLCLETRQETVRTDDLLQLQDTLGRWHRNLRDESGGPRSTPHPTRVQISTGYETQDPFLRNAVLWKGYDEAQVQAFFGRCAAAAGADGEPVPVDEYVMLKPAAGMSDEDAIAEAAETVLHLQAIGEHYGVPVSVRLSPTFAAVGSELHLQLEEDRFKPPTFRDVVAVLRVCGERGLRVPLFVGLHDEGLATEHGTFGNHDLSDPYYRRALGDFNGHQDLDRLLEDVALVEYRLADPALAELLESLHHLHEGLEELSNLSGAGLSELGRRLDTLSMSREMPDQLEALAALLRQLRRD